MSKHYRFDFVGGCRDGDTVSTSSPEHDESTEASFFYHSTQQGTIGKRTMQVSPRYRELRQQGIPADEINIEPHFYEVSECIDGQDEIVVKMKSLGTDDPRKKSETEQR